MVLLANFHLINGEICASLNEKEVILILFHVIYFNVQLSEEFRLPGEQIVDTDVLRVLDAPFHRAPSHFPHLSLHQILFYSGAFPISIQITYTFTYAKSNLNSIRYVLHFDKFLCGSSVRVLEKAALSASTSRSPFHMQIEL